MTEFIYADYEDKLVYLLGIMFNDKTDLIGYKLYEFDAWPNQEWKNDQLKETPEVETWETVYDYLIKHINDKDSKNYASSNAEGQMKNSFRDKVIK